MPCQQVSGFFSEAMTWGPRSCTPSLTARVTQPVRANATQTALNNWFVFIVLSLACNPWERRHPIASSGIRARHMPRRRCLKNQGVTAKQGYGSGVALGGQSTVVGETPAAYGASLGLRIHHGPRH